MQVKMRMEGDVDGRSLASLRRWLSQDPEVVRQVSITSGQQAAGQGQMGAVDLIIAAVGDGTGLGSLVVAYLAWRDSRSKSPSTTIESDGVIVHLSDSSPEDVGRIVAMLEKDEGEER